MRNVRFWKISSLAVLVAATANAQETSTLETGSDGVTYRVTKRVVQRSVPHTEYQTREQTVYRPQTTTQYQTYQQTYYSPVTQYQWVARLRGQWNPFGQPYWSHELTPVTRWEARPAAVQVPTTRTDWVQETRSIQVPVTTYRTVPEEYMTKQFVSAQPTGLGTDSASIASRPASTTFGGEQMESDIPRQSSQWSSQSATDAYRRR